MNSEDTISIVDAREINIDNWLHLRRAIWPEASTDIHRQEIKLLMNGSEREPVGFAEASLRHDYVNGCETSPVAFLEGIYVSPDYRRRRLAARLSHAVERWGREKGCSEFASDTDLANAVGRALHLSLGFIETARVAFCRAALKSRITDLMFSIVVRDFTAMSL